MGPTITSGMQWVYPKSGARDRCFADGDARVTVAAMADGEATATGKSPDGDDESRSEKVNRELIELINELRVALVGVQVLFAFLLAVPFAQGFADVTNFQKALFFVVLLLDGDRVGAPGGAVGLSPHQLPSQGQGADAPHLERPDDRRPGLRRASRSSARSCSIADFIYGSTATTIACAVVGIALFAGLWFVLPVAAERPGADAGLSVSELDWRSGCPDLNRGPPAPKAGALPGCATPRGLGQS